MSKWQKTEGVDFQDDLRALLSWENIHRWVVIGVFVESSGKWHDDHTDQPFWPQPTHFMYLPDAIK